MNQIVNVEWRFGVTAVSSELSQVGSTYIHLKMVIQEASETLRNVYMQMTLPQFYAFLHEMEKAKSQLDYIN